MVSPGLSAVRVHRVAARPQAPAGGAQKLPPRRRGCGHLRTLARLLCRVGLVGLVPGCVLTQPTSPYAGMATHGLPRDLDGSITPAEPEQARGPVGLAEAIAIALANNPELAATGYDAAAVDAQLDVATSQRLPSLHAVSGYTRYADGQRLVAAEENGELGVFSQDIFSGDLVLSLSLFTGGRITSEVRAAELLRAAAEQRLARTREELVFNVTRVFYGVLAQRRVIESLEFSRTSLQEHLTRVQELIAVQKAAKVDQLRTEVRVADVEQRLVRARNVLAVEIRVLASLLGHEGPRDIDPAGTLEMTEAPVVTPDQALLEALRVRPDVLAARAALEAQAKAVDAARAGHWPTVALAGSYGGRWAADPTDRPSGVDSAEDVGRVGVVVDVPLFDGGRVDAKVREQRAKLAAAQERLRKLELQVRLDVAAATLDIASAAERVAATGKAIEQAKESLRIERERYDLGKGSITDVLDAQSALLDTQTTYYLALADHRVALAQLKLATGEQP